MAFFVDDGLVGLRNHVWLQSTLDILVTLFVSIGLQTNSNKTKVMTWVSAKIRVAHTEEAHHAQQNGPADPTAKHHRVECNICGASLAAGSLTSHLETQQDMYWSFVLNQDLAVERVASIYQATADTTGTYFCQVPAYVDVADSEDTLQSHFLRHHPQDLVCSPVEGSLPLLQCDRCGL